MRIAKEQVPGKSSCIRQFAFKTLDRRGNDAGIRIFKTFNFYSLQRRNMKLYKRETFKPFARRTGDAVSTVRQDRHTVRP